MLRVLFAILFSSFCCVYCCAQQLDSVFLLPEATIRSSATNALVHLDSVTLSTRGQQTLTEALQEVPQLFVRNYGPGSLGTMSLMGGTSAHTAIEWNGISIRNPMLGQNDLSLLPLNVFDAVSIDVQGGSAVNGNTQLNGTIKLRSDLALENGLAATLETGSWSRLGMDLRATYGSKNSIRSQTSFFGLSSQNDFPYKSRSERVRQTNASIRNIGITHQSIIAGVAGKPLEISLWWQDNAQNIPPLTTQTQSEASQQTTSTRVALQWNRAKEAEAPTIKLGLVKERLLFEDPAVILESESSFYTLSGAIFKQIISLRHSTLTAGLENRFSKAETMNYGQSRQENQFEPYVQWMFQTRKSSLRAAVRQGFVGSDVMPLSASLTFRSYLRPGLSFDGSISRDLRYVTLNERYWQPGGNEDLQEEASLGALLGLRFEGSTNLRSWLLRIQGFNRSTDNWILWTPEEGQVFWSPQNLSRVWSRGWSIDGRYSLAFDHLTLSSKIVYSYTRSTNQIGLSQPRISQGQQLFYTPIHKAVFDIGINVYGLDLTYMHSITGAYQGIQEDLTNFNLGQLRATVRELNIGDLRWKAWLLVDNIWNTDYRMVERRPMPLRNVRIGVHLEW